MNSTVTKTIDTQYKNGSVTCACGWHKDFGNGFNQYFIDKCPACSSDIATRIQTTVTTGRRGNYKIETGRFVYFAMSNGIHVQFEAHAFDVRYSARA